VKARYVPTPLFKVSNEELEKATPTLIGKPVRVNFQGEPVGIVLDAIYQDGGIDLDVELRGFRAGAEIAEVEMDGSYSNIRFGELSLLTKNFEEKKS